MMNNPARTLLLVSAFILSAASGALADPPKPAQGDVLAGKGYAELKCTPCHAIDEATKVSPNIKAPPFKLVATSKMVTAREIDIWLQSAHPDMPDLIVAAEKRADLIAYIESLAPNKPHN
ncbi:MAG: cytochrome C [Hyphomicrobium sp.]